MVILQSTAKVINQKRSRLKLKLTHFRTWRHSCAGAGEREEYTDRHRSNLSEGQVCRTFPPRFHRTTDGLHVSSHFATYTIYFYDFFITKINSEFYPICIRLTISRSFLDIANSLTPKSFIWNTIADRQNHPILIEFSLIFKALLNIKLIKKLSQ